MTACVFLTHWENVRAWHIEQVGIITNAAKLLLEEWFISKIWRFVLTQLLKAYFKAVFVRFGERGGFETSAEFILCSDRRVFCLDLLLWLFWQACLVRIIVPLYSMYRCVKYKNERFRLWEAWFRYSCKNCKHVIYNLCKENVIEPKTSRHKTNTGSELAE